MFPLGRQLSVFGDDGPVVIQQFRGRFTLVDHGLNGKAHAFLQGHASARTAIVHDLRLFMEAFADAVTTVFTDNRIIVGFGVLLNYMADITELCPRLYEGDPFVHTFLSDFD